MLVSSKYVKTSVDGARIAETRQRRRLIAVLKEVFSRCHERVCLAAGY